MRHSLRLLPCFLFALSLAPLVAPVAFAQNAAPSIPKKVDIDYYNGLGLTPTMGFSTWNGFGCPWITEDLIKATARAMATNGMRNAGYVFVNLDDCWQAGRDKQGLARNLAGRVNGHLIADPVWFPSGMKALGDYIHSLGLKFGLYSTHGSSTCQNVAADLGYEVIDAKDYASWGVDFFKIDTCNGGLPGDPNAFYNRYKILTDALLATGRNIVVEICDFTRGGQAWLWAPQLGNNWRTTGDISGSYMSMRNNVVANQMYREFAGPGHFNNADMMEIGNAGHDLVTSGGYSSLAAPVAVGDTVIQVTSPMTQHNIVGAPIRIGSVWNSSANRAGTGKVESGIVAARGTPAGPPINLFAAASAGDRNVKVGSTAGLTAGSPLLVESVKGGGPSFTYPVTGAPLSGSGFNFPYGAYPLPTGTFESPVITEVGTPGVSTTLASPVAPGAKNIKVANVTDLAVGDTLTIEHGGTIDRSTIAVVGTPAGPVQTIVAPVVAGATNIKVSNVGGFVVGEPLAIDAGSKSERVSVTAIGTAAGPPTTTVAPAAAGGKVVKLASISGLAPGDQIVIDTGAKGEIATIASVGTAANAATTMVAPAAIGTRNVKVASIAGFTVGEDLSIVESGAIPAGAVTEAATVLKIGTAAGPVTQTVTTTPAGITNIRVASINGFVVGETLQVMEYGGRNFETVTVVKIGTAAGPSTTVAKTGAAGDRTLRVVSVAGFAVGEQLVVGVGRRQEIRTVSAVGTAGADGTGITVSEPFAYAHMALDRIRGTGTGIDVTSLTKVHFSGSVTRGQGTGIDVTPLKMAHDLGKTGTGQGQGQQPGSGKSIRGTGTGIVLTAPLQKSHGGFVAARAAGTGITVTPLTMAYEDGVELRGTGTGVTLASALGHAHPNGATVRDQSKPGSGITLDRPLRYPHEMNAVVRGGGTGIKLEKPATMAHPLGEQVGGSSMTVDEARTHMTLWAMEASPLIVGADIPNMAKENLEIYLNRDVIAIDQDPLGIQAFPMLNADNHWIFRKPLANGDVAVAFWNDTTSPWTRASANFAQLELDASVAYTAKDLWSKQTTKPSGGTVTADAIPPHGTVILRITKLR
jgi:hypothetical protein